MMPNSLFFCFQSQLVLAIFSITQNVTAIAELSALSRLAAVFAVVSSVYSNILSPVFLRTHAFYDVRAIYLKLLFGALFLSSCVIALCCLIPSYLLSILGNGYNDRSVVLILIVCSTSGAAFNGIVWNLNSSKGWIYFSSRFYIALTVLFQLLFAVCFDVSRLETMASFLLLTSLVQTVLLVADGVYGLWRY